MNVVTQPFVEEALEAAGLMAWRWDRGRDRIDWSDSAETLLDLPDIVLRSPSLVTRAIHPDDASLLADAFQRACRSGAPIAARFRVASATGQRWFDCAGRAIRDESGHVVGASGTLIEVTEECEAEEAVLGALHDAEGVLDQLGARLWEWDAETDQVTYFNVPEGAHLLAESPHVVPLDEALARMDSAQAARWRGTSEQTLADGKPFTLEGTIRDDDGGVRRILVRGGPASESSTRVRGVTIFLD